jgi:hypothetical protein
MRRGSGPPRRASRRRTRWCGPRRPPSAAGPRLLTRRGGSSAPRSDARSVPCSPLPWQYCSSLFISLLLLSRPRVSGFSSAGWANSSWTSPDSATDLLVSYASDPGTSRDSRGCFFLLSVPVKISLGLRWRLVWPRFLYSLVFHRFPWV